MVVQLKFIISYILFTEILRWIMSDSSIRDWWRQFKKDAQVCIMKGSRLRDTNQSWLKTWFTKLFEKTDVTISDLSTRFSKISQSALYIKKKNVWKLELPQFICPLDSKIRLQMSTRLNVIKVFLERLEMEGEEFLQQIVTGYETLASKHVGSNKELIIHK